MESTEDGAEQCEYDHTGVFVALRLWYIEGWNMWSTRSDSFGGDDPEDSTENERDK